MHLSCFSLPNVFIEHNGVFVKKVTDFLLFISIILLNVNLNFQLVTVNDHNCVHGKSDLNYFTAVSSTSMAKNKRKYFGKKIILPTPFVLGSASNHPMLQIFIALVQFP